MEDPKGKAVEVSVDNMQANVGVIQMEQLASVTFEQAWAEYRAAALRRLEILRKKRKARAAAAAAAASSCPKRRPAKIPIPPAPPAREVDMSTVEFLFEKRLKYSDVKDDGRIVLPKGSAEKYLPNLDAKEGFFMFLDDVDSIKLWMFRYRFWPNNLGRIYVFENTGDFVKAHGLGTGDFIMIYKDNQNERFVVGGRKANVQNAELPINGANVLSGVDNNLPLSFVENGSTFYPDFMPTNETTMALHDQNILQDFPMDLLNVPILDLPEF